MQRNNKELIYCFVHNCILYKKNFIYQSNYDMSKKILFFISLNNCMKKIII